MTAHRLYLYLLLALAGLLLSACVSAPTPDDTLFLLQQDTATATAQTLPTPAAATAAHLSLTLRPVQLAPYLTGDGIVYQTGPNRIVVAGNNRWAAPLQSQLTDGLYQTLDAALADVDIRRPGLPSTETATGYILIVHVQQFQGRYDGKAVISGDWRLLDASNHIAARDDFLHKAPLQQDGYDALVRALSAGWAQVKQTMAKAIGQALTPHP